MAPRNWIGLFSLNQAGDFPRDLEQGYEATLLFITTFPVILATIFNYWIFRYLNRVSPSPVATLKGMNGGG